MYQVILERTSPEILRFTVTEKDKQPVFSISVPCRHSDKAIQKKLKDLSLDFSQNRDILNDILAVDRKFSIMIIDDHFLFVIMSGDVIGTTAVSCEDLSEVLQNLELTDL